MTTTPIVAAIDMGYGHLRPADALARELGTEVLQMDAPPLGDASDARFWARTRKLYEPLTRFSQLPGVGGPMRALLNTITAIPEPWPLRDLSGPTQGTRWMQGAAEDGAGRALAQFVRDSGRPLLTTFYAAAILGELHGAERLYCVVTDSDVNRVWAPPDSRRTRITYFCPTERTLRRLRSYGVPDTRLRYTGFPLPGELVGRDMAALRANLLPRLARLGVRVLPRALREVMERDLGTLPDADEAPLIVFAVGGAGAQVPLAKKLVKGIRGAARAGRLRLALVAGRRPEVARALREALDDAGVDGELLEAPDVFTYFRKLNALLARADVLWTKPSEMTFFAGLGLPIIGAPPVGVHEAWNLRWASERGAALPQHDPETCGEWITEWVEDGTLAGAAWAGFARTPSRGLYEIVDAVAAG